MYTVYSLSHTAENFKLMLDVDLTYQCETRIQSTWLWSCLLCGGAIEGRSQNTHNLNRVNRWSRYLWYMTLTTFKYKRLCLSFALTDLRSIHQRWTESTSCTSSYSYRFNFWSGAGLAVFLTQPISARFYAQQAFFIGPMWTPCWVNIRAMKQTC